MDRKKKQTGSSRRRRHYHVACDHDVVDGDAAARTQCAEEGAFGDAKSERLVGTEFAFDLRNVDEVAEFAGGRRRAMKAVDCKVQLL